MQKGASTAKKWVQKGANHIYTIYINLLILLLIFHISTNNIKKIKYNNNGYQRRNKFMNMFTIFFIGLFIGGLLGITLMCMLQINKDKF